MYDLVLDDREYDKINLHEEALEACVDDPYLFRHLCLTEFDRLGYDEPQGVLDYWV
jgi:hypothetical protein